MSDIGSHDHPEYRAEQAFLRILRQPGIGLDHHARAFLGLALALRYEAEPQAPFLTTARMLLGEEAKRRAIILGIAMRLAYTLSAGTPDLLAGTRLVADHVLTLHLSEGSGVFAGESVTRRLERLGAAMGRDTMTAVVAYTNALKE
jgi:exopolyphosphatase/guanosine-5'-triphosphate,3'-diphosphate pyrophosphatase